VSVCGGAQAGVGVLVDAEYLCQPYFFFLILDGQHRWGWCSGWAELRRCWATPVRVAEVLGSAGEGGAKAGRGKKKRR
ncbi:hypothetical protein FCV25MIE_19241, partial [Fagus crenata]